MTPSRRHANVLDDRGFTLVELIVVVIVLGVLSAIAIPVYSGQQASARDASVVSDVRSTSANASAWLLDNGRTPIAGTAEYVSAGGKVVRSGANVIDVTMSGTGTYTVCGYTAGGSRYGSNASAYLNDSAAGPAGRTTAGCPGDGVAGTPATATPAPTGSQPGTAASSAPAAGGSPTGTSSSSPAATPNAVASAPASTPTPTPSAAPAQWTDCAREYEYCSFTGTRTVRYGLDPSSYVTKRLTGGTACSNDVFGDPAYGYEKRCSYQ